MHTVGAPHHHCVFVFFGFSFEHAEEVLQILEQDGVGLFD